MKHFVYRTLTELAHAADQLGAAHVRFEADAAAVRNSLARPVPVGRFTLGNSIGIHPMEGCDGTVEGAPDELTWRRYERFARGGAKLIWFEATAVRDDGRANTRQLLIAPHTADHFARLLEMIRRVHAERWGTADDLLVPLQLTHSGRYSVPVRSIAYHNPHIDRKTGTPPDLPPVSDARLERLEDDYVSAARLAVQAGFNAVDVKITHGYLLAELSGAKTRAGCYGGSLENRVRFVRNVIGKIRAAVGSNAADRGAPGLLRRRALLPRPCHWRGRSPATSSDPTLTASASIPKTRSSKTWGRSSRPSAGSSDWGVELLNVSMGSPYFNPHIGRPFEKPDEGNYEPPEHPLLGVDRHFRIAGELQRAFPRLPMVGTGYSWLQKFALNAGAANLAGGNIRIFGMGRNALAYPDFAADALEKGELDELRVCKTLTYCTYLMRQKHHPLGQFPTGCPPFDKEGYGPIIKVARATRPRQ